MSRIVLELYSINLIYQDRVLELFCSTFGNQINIISNSGSFKSQAAFWLLITFDDDEDTIDKIDARKLIIQIMN
jgi:hypothetical protein